MATRPAAATDGVADPVRTIGVVLILLPPSESKATPASAGPPIDLATRPRPLQEPTRRVLTALVDLCRDHPARALSALGLSARQTDLVTLNAHLTSAATAPAWQVYTGVLYEALDVASLRGAARRRALSDVWVVSALFGAVALGEAIPAYRLSASGSVPGLPPLRDIWAPAVAQVVADRDPELILDLRSGAYATMVPLPPELRERTVVGKIWQADAGGERTAVSHHNKAYKGHLVRALLQSRRRPHTPKQLVDALAAAGWQTGLDGRRLDIVIDPTEAS